MSLLVLLFLTASFASSEDHLVCVGNETPAGMAITATGTSPSCSGSCQARKLEPVCGVVMKICANQPIPGGYQLDGITSMPACACLGAEGNAYVIRYEFKDADEGEAEPLRLEPSDPTDMTAQERSELNEPYGYPPFGNTLCLEQQRRRGELGSMSQPQQQQQMPPSVEERQRESGASGLQAPQFETTPEPFRVDE